MSEPQHNAVRPDEVEVLLADCLAAPPGEVDTSVAAACEQHPEHAGELRRRLRSLRDLGVLSSFERGEEPPERIGRFRLLRRLGGGGMGVVHLALEEPLGREVALKLMRPEQLWFEGAHRRFLREAEAIASLAHPGIVSIHAFGEHDGLPFCAMEFIAGRSLGEILDGLRGRDPSTLRPGSIGQPGARNWTEACFSLALQVASALRHAHARAIVHRDVKPSNIMLDAEGRVRLIDFGLAHLARSESMTHTGTQPGSLAYMSPEQLRGESIDARTDIYSLGVTLYELLALRMPFRGNNEEQMRRAILDAATPRVDSINRGVARDAAAVVERAMAPEPSRRYPDMTALAADLSAFLEYRPVMARRAGPMLRAQRFVQRRPALATGLLLGFLLAAGLPSAWLLQERAARHAIEAEVQRAQRAELRSAREAEKAARVVAFLQELFDECEPASARGEQVTARTILDRGVQQIRDDLREESEIRTALLTTMGAAYLNLGLLDAARPLLDECAELLRNNPSTTPAERRQVLLLQAQLAGWNGENAEQEALLRAALATMPPPDSDPAAADVLSALGSSLWRQGRLDEGEALLRTAVDRLRQLERGQGIRLGRALQSLASYMQDRVDAASAAPLFAESTAVLRNALSESHPLRIGAAGNQALNLAELGRLPEAESLLREQLVIATRVFDAHHPRRGALEEQIAVVMLRRGNAVQAMHHLEAARRVYSATAHATNPLLARALNLESSIALEIEDLSRADRLAGESLAMYEALFPSGGFDFAMALGNLTRIRTALGRLPEAVQLGQRAVAMHEALAHRDVTAVALARSHLSHALALSGDHAAALATLPPAGPAPSTDRQLRIAAYRAEVLLLVGRTDDAAATLAMLAPALEDPQLASGLRAWLLFLRGWQCNQSGDPVGSIAALTECVARRCELGGEGGLPVAQARTELAVAVARRGDLDAAALLLEQSAAAYRTALGDDSPFRVLPLLNLAAVRKLQQRPQDAVALVGEVLRIQVLHRSADLRTSSALQLVLRTAPALAELSARSAALAGALTAARSLLPEDHTLVQQLMSAGSAARH